ncbi:hypothetical protein ANN_05656 [Periplaneta americana]|uniref:Uncharacterized protein n=1 Tax=Periplaneta americana TaxID=6978 RepID=A0ABQ8TD86_PERAM|nr:hypothetical protein ANN_05656 [Periplaneta americana]
MSDDTTDVTGHMQQIIAFRYELGDAVRERLWGLFNPKVQNAEVLAESILEQLNSVLNGDSHILITQIYDREAVTSGEKADVELLNNPINIHIS